LSEVETEVVEVSAGKVETPVEEVKSELLTFTVVTITQLFT
jgi:hypothetical protein